MNKLILSFTLIVFFLYQNTAYAGEQTYTASNKLKGHYTILNPKLSKRKLKGAFIVLHGSGASASSYAGGLSVFRTIGMDHYLVVAVFAPDNHNNWAKRNYQEKSGNDVFLDELVRKKLTKEYNLDPEKIVFVGFSAGASYIQSSFIPEKGINYRGSFIQLCGGGPPLRFVKSEMERLKGRIKMYIHIATGDFLYNQTRRGIDLYNEAKLFPITSHPKSSGHCNFDMGAELKKAFKKLNIK